LSISENLKKVNEDIYNTCIKYGRDPKEVKLLAVSKTFSIEAINEAASAGQIYFGESRVQEFLPKYNLRPDLKWHFIGHLQSNKINKIAPLDICLQSVDSLELAERLNRRLIRENQTLDVLLQVNIDEDPNKFGFLSAGLWQNIEKILELKGLNVLGLMTIGALQESSQEARASFAKLRRLRDSLSEVTKKPFYELSMGMSSDYKEAIAEGATIVRVGTAIFGRR
jgi:pyridoxal phosphate enzyme (YggS family)